MKQRAFFWKVFLQVGCEYVMVFPLLYLISTLMAPPMPLVFLLSILFFAVLGVLTRRLIPIPWLQLVLGLPISILVAIFLGLTFGSRADPNTYVPIVMLAPFVFYRGKQHAQNDWNAILPVYAPSIIMVFNFAALSLVNYLSDLSSSAFIITVGGVLSLIVSFFAMNYINRRNLAEDQRGHEGSATAISRSLSTQNYLLLGILLTLGLLFSAMPWLVDALWFFVKIAGVVIGWFVQLILALVPPLEKGDTVASGSGNMKGNVLPDVSPFWEIFSKILANAFFVIVAIALAILLFLALRNGMRLLKAILRQMLNQKGITSGENDYFEDTHESLINLRDLPRKYYGQLKNRLSSLKRRQRWSSLTTESERVRYLYRYSLKRAEKSGYHHKTSYTPHEALGEASQDLPQIQPVQDDLAKTYDVVRYAEREPDPGDAARIKEESGL